MTETHNAFTRYPLAHRRAVVTGASAGIGLAVAECLVAGGAHVVLNARRREKLEALASKLNATRAEAGSERPSAVVAPGDCADDDVIASMFEVCEKSFGSPADLVVVNAGRGLGGGVVSSDAEQWEAMIRTNILGALRLMRAAGERMVANIEQAENSGGSWKDQARDIVVIGSTVGRHISPFSGTYGATKFAVNSAAEALRREIGPKGVRVSLVEPGVVVTEFQGVAGYDQEWFGDFAERIGPPLTGPDVADVVGYITSRPAGVHVNDAVIRPTRQDYP